MEFEHPPEPEEQIEMNENLIMNEKEENKFGDNKSNNVFIFQQDFLKPNVDVLNDNQTNREFLSFNISMKNKEKSRDVPQILNSVVFANDVKIIIFTTYKIYINFLNSTKNIK